MAAANSDSRLRDPIVDANPELPRKRERLSEEAEASPLSTDDSVLVEALPPEDEGNSYANAIELDNETPFMDRLSDTFTLQPGVVMTAVDQLNWVCGQFDENTLQELHHIENLARWVNEHIERTADDDFRDVYLDDLEFMGLLGKYCFLILSCTDDLFDPNKVSKHDLDRAGESIFAFHHSVTLLSIRMLDIIPAIVDRVITRRDSGQIPKSRQRIDILSYVQVLAQTTLLLQARGMYFLRDTVHLKPKAMSKERRVLLLQESVLTSLVSVLGKLAYYQGEIANSWDAIDAALRMLGESDSLSLKSAGFIMNSAHSYVLPVICAKHPRALPDGFHEHLVSIAGRILSRLTKESPTTDVAALYDRYIKTDHDALIHEAANNENVLISLQTISNDDDDTLIQLFNNAWVLQALRAFIYSDIMDVRSNGISLLSTRLLELYNAYRVSKEGFDHPVLQYVARFMRTNELTKYIFGPNSHASLVSHSQNIIGFLAATFAYTDLETDIIWHACTNSVEAEFVKASFNVLGNLSRYLDLDHLLYLTGKYASTPSSKLGKDAVETLTDLFSKVQMKSGESNGQDQRLATAFISTDIMMKAAEAEESQSLLRLRHIARTELRRFTEYRFTPDDRFQIYKRCIPDIVDGTQCSTTGVEILLMFMTAPTMVGDEARQLSTALSPSAAIEELARYIEHCRTKSHDGYHSALSPIQMRIELIVRLMALADRMPEDEARSHFCQLTVGNLALGNEARDLAWSTLASLTQMPSVTSIATPLLRTLLSGEVFPIPLTLVTPQLVKLFGMSLRLEAQTEELHNKYALILETPVWHKLVEVAETDDALTTHQLAIETICDALFELARQVTDRSSAMECHRAFTEQQIHRICLESASLERVDTSSICQKIRLLDAILTKSRQYSTIFHVDQRSIVSLGTDSEGDMVQYNLQLYGGGYPQPKVFQLRANKSADLSQLAAKVPSITGASDNRVIVGGKLLALDDRPERLLSDAGLLPGGVILVCPKHTSRSDLNTVLPPSSAVEQAIVANYDELEKLLDGPDAVANKVYLFMKGVRPPSHVRQRLVSGTVSNEELCPSTGIWRTVASFDVLHTHLTDFVRLGVADEAFLRRGIDLVVSVLIDNRRLMHLETCKCAMSVLGVFLQGTMPTTPTSPLDADLDAELPESTMTPELVVCPESFARRMIDICFFALQQDFELHYYRRSLVENAMKAMLQLFRRQPSIWQHFKDDARVIEMYSQILFDVDLVIVMNATEMLRNFAIDPSTGTTVTDFYLHVVLNLLPQALEQGNCGTTFFDLATEVMFANNSLKADDARIRDIIATLTSSLWNYNHTETVDLALADMAVAGLLRLLTEAINILKSFKKPLHLQGLSVELMSRLLFPRDKSYPARPLIDQHSRRLAYRLIQVTCESEADFACILQQLSAATSGADDNPSARYPGLANWTRPPSKCSGLPNLGMTCYMNSLLQQLFANVHFRKFIFNTPVVDEAKQPLLVEVQSLFAQMQDLCNPTPDTVPLARVLGIQTDSQEDVHGFYEDFLSRLESNMPDVESKKSLANFFTGKMIQQIKGECGHVSPQTEPFVDLPVVVRNKSCLSESLDEYVQGEPMEGANRYKCQACQTENGGRLVNAMKRSCPEETPDNLTFCLKRFTYESMVGIEGKVNDRFDFPQMIDMSRYKRQFLEDPTSKPAEDIYELVGVIVHQGTLHLGHYWSYTLLRNTSQPQSRNWVKLEDRNVSFVPGGVEEVQQECFGGQRYSNGNERADNAYVLFYERKERLEEVISLPGPAVDPASLFVLPPRLNLPERLKVAIHDQNAWRQRVAHLFDDDFHEFMKWLLDNVEHYTKSFTHDSSSNHDEDDSNNDGEDMLLNDAAEEDIVSLLGRLAMLYVQRISVCDSKPMKRTREYLERLVPLAKSQVTFAAMLLERFLDNPDWPQRFTEHENQNLPAHVNTFIIVCLKTLHLHDHPSFLNILRNIKSLYGEILQKLNPTKFNWVTSLNFAQQIARLGVEGTVAILEDCYWTWVFDMIRLPLDASLRKRYPGVLEHIKLNPSQFTALYNFLHELLTGHVDLVAAPIRPGAGTARQITSSGVQLTQKEMNDLVRSSEAGNSRGICFWMRTSQFASKDCDWQDSGPGRLMAVLTSSKAPLSVMRAVEDSLLRHIEIEEEYLNLIIQLVMNFCASCASDHDPMTAKPVFTALVKVLNQWDGADREFSKVIGNAYQIIPHIVLSCLELWIMSCLTSKQISVRGDIAKWLDEVVFLAEEPLTGPPEVDIVRLHQARKIATRCSQLLQAAYDGEKPRSRWGACISVAMTIERYLCALVDKVRVIQASGDEEEDARLGPSLLVELGEVDVTLNELHRLELDCIEQWELDEALPGTVQDVRHSVEIGSDDSDIEDWEEEDEV